MIIEVFKKGITINGTTFTLVCFLSEGFAAYQI